MIGLLCTNQVKNQWFTWNFSQNFPISTKAIFKKFKLKCSDFKIKCKSENWKNLKKLLWSELWLLRSLTLSWRRSLSYGNQPIDLLCKSMNWFLYDRDLRHEGANPLRANTPINFNAFKVFYNIKGSIITM